MTENEQRFELMALLLRSGNSAETAVSEATIAMEFISGKRNLNVKIENGKKTVMYYGKEFTFCSKYNYIAADRISGDVYVYTNEPETDSEGYYWMSDPDLDEYTSVGQVNTTGTTFNLEKV